jgi:hypothetical protein
MASAPSGRPQPRPVFSFLAIGTLNCRQVRRRLDADALAALSRIQGRDIRRRSGAVLLGAEAEHIRMKTELQAERLPCEWS